MGNGFTGPARHKVLILSKIRCAAIRPRSSPLYAFAEAENSAKEPTNLPVPAEHSMKKAVEQRSVLIEGIYEPSATIVQVLFTIAACIQAVSPCHWRTNIASFTFTITSWTHTPHRKHLGMLTDQIAGRLLKQISNGASEVNSARCNRSRPGFGKLTHRHQVFSQTPLRYIVPASYPAAHTVIAAVP